MLNETHATQQHEDDNDVFNHRAVEPGDARRAGGKSAGTQGGEGLAHGLEAVHAGQPEGNDLQQRQQDVDLPQGLGGLEHARREPLGLGAGEFGAVEIHAALPDQRQDRQPEQHDAHAAQPVGEAAPQLNRL